MKAIRRFGFILIVLFLGVLIGRFTLLTVSLIFIPLLILWGMLWDNKKQLHKQNYSYHDYYYFPDENTYRH